MTITLKRMVETPHGTFGLLTYPGVTPWYTVERMSTGEHPRIPAGTYEMKLGMYYGGDGIGGKVDYPAYEIIVPGRKNIKIHVANLASELLGCIAPGLSLGFLHDQLAVLSSHKAFDAFMFAMHRVPSDYIVVL